MCTTIFLFFLEFQTLKARESSSRPFKDGCQPPSWTSWVLAGCDLYIHWIRVVEGLPYSKSLRNLLSLIFLYFAPKRAFCLRTMRTTQVSRGDNSPLPTLSNTLRDKEKYLKQARSGGIPTTSKQARSSKLQEIDQSLMKLFFFVIQVSYFVF